MARILVVDDEEPIARMIKLALVGAGHDVVVATSASEAMRMCYLQAFDLVLSDVQMPSMDGHALVRWVAEHYPGTRLGLISGSDPGCDSCPRPPRCPQLGKPFKSLQEIADFVARLLATAPP